VNAWWWVPIGLAAWCLVSVVMALGIGAVLRRASQARKSLDRQAAEISGEDDPYTLKRNSTRRPVRMMWVLVADDSGDRKDGARTAHVGHQWLGRYGKTDSGVVTVTTSGPMSAVLPGARGAVRPARHFPKGKSDPGFRTKLAIDAGVTFPAVAAASAYGDQDGFRGELAQAGLPFVMALMPRHGTWAYGPDVHTPRTPPAP
jgi:SRSO17 transposase